MDNQKNAGGVLEEFAGSIRDLTGVIRNITRIEREKAEAASLGRHDQIDGFLKREQVYLLKLRGLEKKRLQLVNDLGFQNLTFQQILNRAEDSQKKLLSPLFADLEQELRSLKDAESAAEKIIRVRLREFEYILSTEKGQTFDSTDQGTHFHDRYV